MEEKQYIIEGETIYESDERNIHIKKYPKIIKSLLDHGAKITDDVKKYCKKPEDWNDFDREIQNNLLNARFIDLVCNNSSNIIEERKYFNILRNSETNYYSDISRLKTLIKKNGIPSKMLRFTEIHLCDDYFDDLFYGIFGVTKKKTDAPIEEIFRKIIKFIEENRSTPEYIAAKIEIPLGVLINKLNPDKFPFGGAYSSLKNWIDRGNEQAIKTKESYNENTDYIPYNFYKFIINMRNIDHVLDILIKHSQEADDIFKALGEIIVSQDEVEAIKKLKSEYDKINPSIRRTITEQNEVIRHQDISLSKHDKEIHKLEKKLDISDQTIESLRQKNNKLENDLEEIKAMLKQIQENNKADNKEQNIKGFKHTLDDERKTSGGKCQRI